MTVWPLYAAASAATIGFAALSLSDKRERMVAALALACVFLCYKIARIHHTSIAYPIMDAALGYLFLSMWLQRPMRWVAQLFALCILMSIAHVVYQTALWYGWQIGYAYRTVLNGLFLCQLWIVGRDGAKRGIDRIGRGLVHARGAWHHGARALARMQGGQRE